MLNDLLKLEEESLGARTDKLADIYQLMSKTKSEVTALTLSLFFLSFLSGKKGFYTSQSVSVNLQHPPPLPPTQAMQGLKRAKRPMCDDQQCPGTRSLGWDLLLRYPDREISFKSR